jgi:hypothetical protein
LTGLGFRGLGLGLLLLVIVVELGVKERIVSV